MFISFKVIRVILLFFVVQFLNIEAARSEIHFQAKPLTLLDLPATFTASFNYAYADIEGDGTSNLIVSGDYSDKGISRSGIFVLKVTEHNLSMKYPFLDLTEKQYMDMENAKKDPQPSRISIENISTCDLNKDGRDEIYVICFYPQYSCSVILKDDRLTKSKLPFEALDSAVPVWFDYDNDGWVDLFLAGLRSPNNEDSVALEPIYQLYKNQQGRLILTNILFNIPDKVDSAYVIDFDEDGKLDLFLGCSTAWNARPSYNRIFLNKRDHFEEIEYPLSGTDRLMGLSRAHVVSHDFNGDNLSDILISGCWHDRLGSKAFISLIYKKSMTIIDGHRKYELKYDRNNIKEIPNILGKFILEDLDGDGDTDIFIFGFDAQLNTHVFFLENENSKFSQVHKELWLTDKEKLFNVKYYSVCVPYDVNQDGLMDIICFSDRFFKKNIVLVNTSVPPSQIINGMK